MAKKNVNEDAGAKFRQVSNQRCVKALRYIGLLKTMPYSNAFEISPDDARQLRLVLEKEITPLYDVLIKIEQGTFVKKQKKEDITDIWSQSVD